MSGPPDFRGFTINRKAWGFRKMTLTVAGILMSNSSPLAMAQTLPPIPALDYATTARPTLSAMRTTLAPIILISPTPATSPPPTPPPVPQSPTLTPSISPSQSAAPTAPPSFEPTNYPTSSNQPSTSPTTSAAPTFPPSPAVPSIMPTAQPTVSPSFASSNSPSSSHQPSASPTTSAVPSIMPTAQPTISPVFAPSDLPSTNAITSVKRECEQYLEVNASEKFTEEQVEIYELLMQSYTADFGEMVANPQIVTTCEVTGQDLAGGRRRRAQQRIPFFNRFLQQPRILLVMKFTMQYESRYGYDVEDYPRQFQTYVNSNLEKVTEDMNSRFLPVIEAQEVIVFNTNEPTISPSGSGGSVENPTASPTGSQVGELPTNVPSLRPSTSRVPTFLPSASPVVTAEPINGDGEEDQTSFIVGLAAGLGGAAIIILLVIWYMRRKNQQKDDEDAGNRAGDPQSPMMVVEEGLEVGGGAAASSQGGVTPGQIVHRDSHSGQYENYPEDNNNQSSSPVGGMGTVADSIFSNPSMVSGGGSFSSDPEDHHRGVPVNALQDEFDSYKNQDLEWMREGVEESVYGAEGMMSLAMTRALMEDEDVGVNLSWGGAEDPESIEANGLCETNDWLRKHDNSTVDERNLFFQEILNKMVITVRRGMMSPSDGTRAIHCCAAMLGLQLEKELPNNVLLVHGMRKTNDLSLGRSYLVETFQVFGDIEGASIAPNNRGFGFVRFVSPKSVQRALERFRISEIEVQDVSVMIKSLKSGGKAV